MNALLFVATIIVGAYGLRIAYGLANSLRNGAVRLRMQGQDVIVTREQDPVRFWLLWLVGAGLVALAIAYITRRAGLI